MNKKADPKSQDMIKELKKKESVLEYDLEKIQKAKKKIEKEKKKIKFTDYEAEKSALYDISLDKKKLFGDETKTDQIKNYVGFRRILRYLKHISCLLAPLIIAFLTVLLISSAGIQMPSQGEMYLFSTDAAGLEENLSKGVISEDLKKIFADKGFPLSKNASIIINETDEWGITKEGKVVISEELRKVFNVSNETDDNWEITKEEMICAIGKENKTLNVSKELPLSGNVTISSETEEWEIKNEGKIYTIRKEEGKLNIYGKIIRARYVIAIIFLPYVIVLILTFLYIPINYYFTKVEVNWRIFVDKLKKTIYISTCIAVIALLVCILLSFWYDFVLQF